MNDVVDEVGKALDPLAKYRNCWQEFSKKSYGRIWVREENDIVRVDAVIKKMDEFEHSYLPEEFIGVYAGDLLDLVYGHKFEMSTILLEQACLSIGIWVVCVTGFRESP